MATIPGRGYGGERNLFRRRYRYGRDTGAGGAQAMTGDETSATRTRVTADDVLCGLWREARAGDLNAPSMARVRALELVGKHLGMFVDRVEVTIERRADE